MTEKANPFKAMMAARKEEIPSEIDESSETDKKTEPDEKPDPIEAQDIPAKRKRGRPATGKRSDPGWIGRTYYIQESTDIDVELELAMLRRQGIEKDKSALVDSLLGAWVKWRNGENPEILLSEISPRRKDK